MNLVVTVAPTPLGAALLGVLALAAIWDPGPTSSVRAGSERQGVGKRPTVTS